MKKIELSVDERNLLSVAYKNIVGMRREAWRVVRTLEAREKGNTDLHHDEGKHEDAKKHENRAQWCREYRAKIEGELIKICNEVLSILMEHLIPTANADIAASISCIIITAEKYKDRAVESLETDLHNQLTELEEKSHFLTKIQNGECLVFYFKM